MQLSRLSNAVTHIPLRLMHSLRTRGLAETWRRAGLLALALRRGTLGWKGLSDPVRRARLLRVTWPVRDVRASTTYVFVFLGEFGYELFNWQGVIRKFAVQLPASSRIVVAGKRGLEAFYETASQYLDISDFPPYRESVAAAYWAIPPGHTGRDQSPTQLAFDRRLREEFREHITKKLGLRGRIEFVFSSSLTAFPGCIFGGDHRHYGRPEHPGRIYAASGMLENNLYARILPDPGVQRAIEEELGFDLSRPYVLVQTRRRAIGPQCGMSVEEAPIVAALARRLPVIVLTFDSGRALDSVSALAAETGTMVFAARSFREQGCLIAHAARCIFVTNGDLGSHTYLPPLMGRDVDIVASADVLARPSAPRDFWNRHVFRFGGQMNPIPAEPIFASDTAFQAAIDGMVLRACASRSRRTRLQAARINP